MLLAIDPGHAGAGNACAQFGPSGELQAVWFERVPTYARGKSPPVCDSMRAAWDRNAKAFDVIVVEQPAYQGLRTQRARPADLMNLCWSGALLAGAFAGRDGCPIVAVTSADWKGTEPKPQHHARLWAALSYEERAVLGGTRTAAAIDAAVTKGAMSRWSKPGAAYYPRTFTTHNLLDAAALGCWYLRRLEKR